MSNKNKKNPYLTGKVETLSSCARKVLSMSDMGKMPASTFQGVNSPYAPGKYGDAVWSSSKPEWRIVVMARRLRMAVKMAWFYIAFFCKFWSSRIILAVKHFIAVMRVARKFYKKSLDSARNEASARQLVREFCGNVK